jgi:hypothetical protein
MISRDNIQDIYPLTPFQESVLFHDLMDQSAEASGDTQRAYFQQVTFRIRGPLDLDLFQKCWDRLIARQTSFARSSAPAAPTGRSRSC